MSALRIAVVLPHLRAGGIEKSAILLFNHLHGERFAVHFVLSALEGELVSEISSQIPVVDLGGKRAMRSVPHLRRVLSGLQVDAVYSGTNARNIATLMAASLIPRRRRPAVLISEHTQVGPYLEQARHRRLRRFMMRRLYPGADMLLAPDESLGREWLDRLGLNRPPVAGMPNPILRQGDLDLADRVRRGAGPLRDPTLVLSVGRLTPVKGHDLLLHAFAIAAKQRPELRLEILGEGPERARLEALARKLSIAERVSLPGYSPGVIARMASAGLVVVPSRREGFGNVVVEALAAGAPVLATDCPGPRRILAGVGASGRIVARDDAPGMAQAIVEMAGQPAAMGDAADAVRQAISRYSVPAAASAFADLVEQAVAERKRHA